MVNDWSPLCHTSLLVHKGVRRAAVQVAGSRDESPYLRFIWYPIEVAIQAGFEFIQGDPSDISNLLREAVPQPGSTDLETLFPSSSNISWSSGGDWGDLAFPPMPGSSLILQGDWIPFQSTVGDPPLQYLPHIHNSVPLHSSLL